MIYVRFAAIGYSGTTMRIRMASGEIYDYSDVPAYEVTSLMFADSIGQRYNQYIKGHYKSQWLNDPREAVMVGVVEGGAK